MKKDNKIIGGREKRFGGNGKNSWNIIYQEKEYKDEIIITAKMTINKNSKSAMNTYNKYKKQMKSPLIGELKKEENWEIKQYKEEHRDEEIKKYEE